jgi:hypothetical protein
MKVNLFSINSSYLMPDEIINIPSVPDALLMSFWNSPSG